MRITDKDIAAQFTGRWSSRAYDGKALTEAQIDMLLEAARWAPSCFNEQPWVFYYGKTEEQRSAYFSLLVEANRDWVANAGFLCYLVARKTFARNGERNRHHAFDAGAAWMSLALQAHTMGLSAHAMAGFDLERAYEVLGVDEADCDILAAIAVGKPVAEAVRDEPRTPRKAVDDMVVRDEAV